MRIDLLPAVKWDGVFCEPPPKTCGAETVSVLFTIDWLLQIDSGFNEQNMVTDAFKGFSRDDVH